MSDQESSASWKKAWSQQERRRDSFISWCYDVTRKLPFNAVNHIHIFNCSDGPAALGIVLAILQKNPSLHIELTDNSQYAIGAAKKFIQEGVQNVFGSVTAVSMDAVVQDTPQLLMRTQDSPQHYISFEPVSVSLDIFETAYQQLVPSSSITVIGRGRMGPVSQLGIAGKHAGADITIASGMITPSGEITAVMLSK